MNEQLIQKTNRVLETLVDLQIAGVEVDEVVIGPRNPVIRLLGTPQLRQQTVVRSVRTRADGAREAVHTTNIRGCQVEWLEVA